MLHQTQQKISDLYIFKIMPLHFKNNILGNLVKNIGENDFYHLSQEFNADALDLVSKKELFPYDYRDNFENFKEGLHNKNNFCN